MKKFTTILALILAFLMVFTACGNKESGEAKTDSTTSTGETASTGTSSASEAFNYSSWVDESGRWKGITATDYVDMAEYKGITLSGVTPSDEEIMNEINSLLEEHAQEFYNYERAVEDGDTVNIDYVGSVDGVEFEGGNTQGGGAEVTAGSSMYIDDFLTQIIGHYPGETFDVNVTFPEDYGKDELNGKDAVFVTTINYIVDKTPVTYTNEAIAANLYEEYGVSTTTELYDYVTDYMLSDNIYDSIEDYIFENFSCKSIPDSLTEYQKASMKSFYQQYADYYGVVLDTFVLNYMGMNNMDAVYENYADDMNSSSQYFLFMQSIAEKEGIIVKDSDVEDFLNEQVGADMVDSYRDFYGVNYLKMLVSQNKVFDLIRENAVID